MQQAGADDGNHADDDDDDFGALSTTVTPHHHNAGDATEAARGYDDAGGVESFEVGAVHVEFS
jgi:hypothetical protein